MIVSTSNIPGRGTKGKKSDAKIPCRAHVSIIIVPHPIDHTIVHIQPQIPPTLVSGIQHSLAKSSARYKCLFRHSAETFHTEHPRIHVLVGGKNYLGHI